MVVKQGCSEVSLDTLLCGWMLHLLPFLLANLNLQTLKAPNIWQQGKAETETAWEHCYPPNGRLGFREKSETSQKPWGKSTVPFERGLALLKGTGSSCSHILDLTSVLDCLFFPFGMKGPLIPGNHPQSSTFGPLGRQEKTESLRKGPVTRTPPPCSWPITLSLSSNPVGGRFDELSITLLNN